MPQFARNFASPEAFVEPSRDYFAITPHNTTDCAYLTRSIRVGGAGDVQAVREDGAVVSFLNCYAGEILPIVAKRVNATGTTATGLVGL